MPIACKILTDRESIAWDRFVEAAPSATFFHRAGWRRVLSQSFGHDAHFLFTERDGAITGILPLVHLKTRLFGNSLVSLPFCVYGGPVATDEASHAALEAKAAELMGQTGADVLEYRISPDDDAWHSADHSPEWQVKSDLYVTFRRAIDASDETNMKSIPRKQRAMVRKGIDLGLVSKVDHDIDALYAIYSESVRNLGTPVFPRRYFSALRETFGHALDIVTVRDAGQPIASVMNFYFRDQVLPYYGGSLQAARMRYGNDFMYWEVMRRAAARGYRTFDFGRSKSGTGAYSFKKNWGFTPEPLSYVFKTKPGKQVPDHNPLNPKYRLMIAAWKKLPLPVANALGPFVVRGVG